MGKFSKLSIICCCALALAGTGIGVTLAANYTSPGDSKVYQFGQSGGNFQSYDYYFAGGNGTSATPYLIKNTQQLRNLSKLQNIGAIPASTYVSLASSFQYQGDAMEPIGNSDHPWVGVFNGNDFCITGLKVSTTKNNAGMFGVIGKLNATGTVHNLVLAGPSITRTGTGTVNIGIITGTLTTDGDSHVSVVNHIEIYGGTSGFTAMRAKIVSTSATPTSRDAIIGTGAANGEGVGFVTSLALNNQTHLPAYSSTAVFTGISSTGTYQLWNNNGTVVNS